MPCSIGSNEATEMDRRNTPFENVAAAARDLAKGAGNTLSVAARIRICRRCIDTVYETAREWAERAAIAKGLPATSSIRAEDLLSGPAVVARQLQLTIQTLTDIQRQGCPRLTGSPRRLSGNQLSVPVFPTNGLYDSLTFMGIRGSVRLQRGGDPEEIHGTLARLAADEELTGVTGILGAGNVSSIPATDSLNKIMFERRCVLLKMNPVNEYLAPIFARALAPLIKAGLLRILTGGPDVGSEMIHHELVDDVHITGCAATHDTIVWGSDAAERRRRKQDNDPALKKSVTSELGNVTPWIIVPGDYKESQLRSQAQHVAASITNNSSFNCLATKVIVTWKNWPQRDIFLDLLRHYLSATPVRPGYYPGATERFERFSGFTAPPDPEGCLPWTLLTGQSIDARPDLFQEESFVCVCAETQLDATSPAKFLEVATNFVNDRVTGTLCASVSIPPGFRSQQADAVERCITDLRYGSVCINQWSGLAYGLVSPPWGAYPGATPENVQSGIGNVHNTYLLDRIEKTVLEGPLINFPRPVWFPSHGRSVDVATRLVQLYHRPSVFRLPGLFSAALLG
ncbi:MAG: aldehyde dehydrogenase family protein [Fuerstiella sp.]|nr:aldehyde dehydrogenase family protein [Fuerstiella sp.]